MAVGQLQAQGSHVLRRSIARRIFWHDNTLTQLGVTVLHVELELKPPKPGIHYSKEGVVIGTG